MAPSPGYRSGCKCLCFWKVPRRVRIRPRGMAFLMAEHAAAFELRGDLAGSGWPLAFASE
jgi:hypothetical protein